MGGNKTRPQESPGVENGPNLTRKAGGIRIRAQKKNPNFKSFQNSENSKTSPPLRKQFISGL